MSFCRTVRFSHTALQRGLSQVLPRRQRCETCVFFLGSADADWTVGNHWHAGYEHVVCCEGQFEDESGTYKVCAIVSVCSGSDTVVGSDRRET